MATLPARFPVFAALACILGEASGAQSGAVIREPNAIYLEDFGLKSLNLQVLTDASIFYDTTLKRYLGTLRKGDKVEVQAVSDKAYRVRGRAQQGQVIGWVRPQDLTPLTPDFLAKLKKAEERRKAVAALIARNEVAIGMVPEEVQASLGKAKKKSTRVDASGRGDVWEYIRYETVIRYATGYDSFGRLVQTPVTVKIPVGSLSVIFNNGLVTAIEQSEGTLADGGAKIVPSPLEINVGP